VYFANWYAGLSIAFPGGTHVPVAALRPFTEALISCGRAGATIRGLLWDGSMHELERRIASYLSSKWWLPSKAADVIRARLMRFAVSKTNHAVNGEAVAYLESLRLPNLVARLDDETLTFGSHHQKLLVVGNSERTVAILGGVDLHRNRVFPVQDSPGTPYFDISVQLDGQAAADIAEIFERRWLAHPSRRGVQLPRPTAPVTVPTAGGATVQVGVNFGCRHPHMDIPNAIRGADRLIRNVLSNCRSFFYAEDQYGVGNAELGEAITRAFANGARFGVVVLADAWGVDDLPEIDYRRHRFWTRFPQVRTGQLLVFQRRGDDGRRKGPHAYVHSKLVIVDDLAATIGSVNMNRRSWYYDSELAAAITDSPDTIQAMRVGIWRQHLKPGTGDVSERELADPMGAFRLWQEAHAKSPPWYDFDARTAPRPRLSALTFGAVPDRLSVGILPDVMAALQLAKLVVAAPLGVGAALALPSTSQVKRLIDDTVDFAYDNIFDPTGPASC
jgi:phosphatidylserine/phosphatidylglycerophosphate/cardiolipin synthase-like enzyme